MDYEFKIVMNLQRYYAFKLYMCGRQTHRLVRALQFNAYAMLFSGSCNTAQFSGIWNYNYHSRIHFIYVGGSSNVSAKRGSHLSQVYLYFWIYVVSCLVLIYASVDEVSFSTPVLALFALSGIILQNQQYSNYYFYEFEGEDGSKDFSNILMENGWNELQTTNMITSNG